MNSVKNQIWNKVRNDSLGRLMTQFEDELHRHVYYQLMDQIWIQIWVQVLDKIRRELR